MNENEYHPYKIFVCVHACMCQRERERERERERVDFFFC